MLLLIIAAFYAPQANAKLARQQQATPLALILAEDDEFIILWGAFKGFI